MIPGIRPGADWQVRVETQGFGFMQVAVWFYRDNGSMGLEVARPTEGVVERWEVTQHEGDKEIPPSFLLPINLTAALASALHEWAEPLGTPDARALAGKLERTDAHLADMRALVFGDVGLEPPVQDGAE